MPTEYNWALIRSGETFQSLLNTLLLFEEPNTQVFGRLGKDAGQDSRSADAARIYQYKFHTQASISKVISDANEELAKITDYRKPTDTRHDLWKHAKEWVLVTNIVVNPNDVSRWTNEIEPGFRAIGLEAKLWSLERLNALLTKHPHVAEAYFEGKNRCFLSVAEAFEFAKADEIGESGSKVALIGREAEMKSIDAFLQGAKKLLCAHGPGGIGKSRLLLEVGQKAESAGFQVLWAIEATMSKSENWFSAIRFDAPTLLLLDEPQDPRLVHILVEQLKLPLSPMKSWKVIIAVRSPKDPVLRAADETSSSLKESPIALGTLSKDSARTLALQLMDASSLAGLPDPKKNDIAEHLSRLGDRYPIWIAMAVRVLSKAGTISALPSNAKEIASKSLDEVIEFSSERIATKKQVQDLLRWLALYEELNIEDLPVIAFITKQAGFADQTVFNECLTSLVARRFVVRRGVNDRLYSIKPDVMRDFVLRTWLILEGEKGPEASAAAKGLVKLLIEGDESKPIPKIHHVIRALAKSEFAARLQKQQLDLLSPLTSELMTLAAEGTVLQQGTIIPLINSFAFARIADALALFQTIRMRPKPSAEVEELFGGTTEVKHSGVVSELAWPLFETAHCALTREERMSILHEMAELSLFEFKIPGLFRNDGKRADALIPRIISGGESFYTSFQREAFDMAMGFIEKAKALDDADEPTLNLMRVFCEPFLSLEREHTSLKDNTFTVRRWFIAPESPDWQNRDRMKVSLKGFLTSPSGNLKSRPHFWRLLSFAHGSANRARIDPQRINEHFVAAVCSDLSDDLAWLLEVLNVGNLPIAELQSARRIWDWHHRFDKTLSLKIIADQCEALYQQNPLVSAFQVFFSHEMQNVVQKKAEEVGATLAAAVTSADIHGFIEQAEQFAAGAGDWGNILQVADYLGGRWQSNDQIERFVNQALGLNPQSVQFSFAGAVLNRRFKDLRAQNAEETLSAELGQSMGIVTDLASKERLLISLYGRPHPFVTGILIKVDLDFAATQIASHLKALEPWTKLQLLSGMYHIQWDRVRVICDEIWAETPESDKVRCFLQMLSGMTFLDLFKQDYATVRITEAQFDWLLRWMLDLPDLDQIGEHCQWELDQLSERLGRKGLDWFLSALETRIRKAEALQGAEGDSFKIASTRNGLTNYVAKISAATQISDKLRQEIGRLLQYAERKDVLGYILPEYASDIDPHGVLVPELIETRIKAVQTQSKEDLWQWSRFAGYYGPNSLPWRRIAKASLIAAEGLPPRDRNSIFVALLPQEIQSSNFPAGEMDPRPEQELNNRKRELQEETDPVFAPFRRWRLQVAQAEYNQTLAEYREERGE